MMKFWKPSAAWPSVVLLAFAATAIVGCSSSSTPSLNAEPRFRAQAVYSVAEGPRAIAAADLERDGKPDLLVTAGQANVLTVLRNTGSGKYARARDFATGDTPTSIATGDFNGDNNLDAAVANYNSYTVSVLLGDGHGGFAPKVDYKVDAGPHGIVTADFDGDGTLDLAVVNSNGNLISILPGVGDGTFAPKVDYAAGNAPTSIAVGDFNNDGKPDLAVANFVGNEVGVFYNRGDGTFADRATYGTGAGPYGIATADINGDGFADIIVTNLAGVPGSISVLPNASNTTFRARADFEVGARPQALSALPRAQGWSDLAVVSTTEGRLYVLHNDHVGGFPSEDYAVGKNPQGLAVADLNGDGRPDVVVANEDDNTVSVLLASQ